MLPMRGSGVTMRFVRERHWRADAPRLLAVALGATLFAAAAAYAGDAAGMRVYRDPATGEFIAPPPDAPDADRTVAPDAAARALSTAPGALVEEPGTSPAGGVTLDLQGRFQSDESATIDATGAVRTRCRGTEAPR